MSCFYKGAETYQQSSLTWPQVLLADCGAQGRGLMAGRKLWKGEKILKVPEGLLITADTAMQGGRN